MQILCPNSSRICNVNVIYTPVEEIVNSRHLSDVQKQK